MPKPVKPLPGTAEVNPDPVQLGTRAQVSGQIPAGSYPEVWFRFNVDGNQDNRQQMQSQVVAADGSFTGESHNTFEAGEEGPWSLVVLSPEGPKAKVLARDTFVVE